MGTRRHMRVLLLTQFGEKGGSSRIQALQFLPLFRANGFEVIARAVYPDRFFTVQMGLRKVPPAVKMLNLLFFAALAIVKKFFFALAARRFDVVVIQKETFPKVLFRFLLALNPHVVYELDDTIFEENPYHREGVLRTLLLRYQVRLCRYQLRRAAFVVAENEYLAAEARRHNQKVAVLSAPIDTKRFTPRRTPKGAGEPVVIGWIGSPSTTYLLEGLAPVFTELARRVSGWKLVTVGARSDFSIAGIPLEKREWKLPQEQGDLQSFDVGLMPLDDAPFNRGRLGYKMIQYMAVGTPTVAEDIGLNRSVIQNGRNGFLVSGVGQWTETLVRLIGDAGLRKTLGTNARCEAEERFSLKKQFEVWKRVIVEVGSMK